jgi:two-component system LytT family sensor kinase
MVRDDSSRPGQPIGAGLIFTVATVLALSSTIQSWRLQVVTDKTFMSTPVMAKLFVLNSAYWYVPALLAPIVMAVTRRYRLGRTPWPAALAFHVGTAFLYSLVHTGSMLATRALLFENGGRGAMAVDWWSYIQRQYLTQLDWLLATYFFLVGLGHAMEYWRESRERAVRAERLQTRLAEAQFQALQRQLQPHFLFNTLHTISSLMRSDVDAADMMIDRLSELLRMSLRAQAQEVTVRQELDILQSYLGIEQTRFRDRLSVVIAVDPDLLDARVPHLLLQPLVENAVRHGIAPRARPGRIEIRAARRGDRLDLDVTDTGDGAPPDRLHALNDGVGLSNTRARLKHLYGDDHRFTFANRKEGGFQVSISIPYRTAALAADDAADTIDTPDTIDAEVA